MIEEVGRRLNYTMNHVVSKVTGGVFFGKFTGDYGLVVSQRVFGSLHGPAIQPQADSPYFAGIGFAVGVLFCGAVLEHLTRRFGEVVEDVAGDAEEAVEE